MRRYAVVVTFFLLTFQLNIPDASAQSYWRWRRRIPTPTVTQSPLPTIPPASTASPTPIPPFTPTPIPTVTPTVGYTPRPTVTPNVTPTGSPVPIPNLALWESQMLTYGALHCSHLNDPFLSLDSQLAATFYDAEWVFYQIGDYTGDENWYNCAQSAESIYRDSYLYPNNGQVPGYWNFSHGLTKDYFATGDANSRDAVVLLSGNAAYAPESTPLSWTEDAELSREVAYAIMNYLNAEQLGEPHRARCDQFVNQALGHLNQWFVLQTAPYVRPFMFALTAHALISYDTQKGDNPDILPAITRGANWIWDNMWLPGQGSFKYTNKETATGGQEPSPDLNLLIAPVYAWLWHQTGNPIFRDRADQIFSGGVLGAWLVNAKQFNQNYRWSFDYLRWRNMTPIR